jgi:plastocyanin
MPSPIPADTIDLQRCRSRRGLLALLAIPALAGITLAAAACGGDDSSAPAPTIPPGALVVVAEPGLRLDAETYTATAGSVVIAYVQNDPGTRHTLVVKGADGVVIGDKLEVVKKNDVDTGTYTLAPGTYVVYCDVPGHGTMKATLTVT